jgi:hypothetical protein
MKILVPTDGSKYADQALVVAIDLVKKAKGGELCLISVAPAIEEYELQGVRGPGGADHREGGRSCRDSRGQSDLQERNLGGLDPGRDRRIRRERSG